MSELNIMTLLSEINKIIENKTTTIWFLESENKSLKKKVKELEEKHGLKKL